jgi:hypothetical protein
MTHRETPTLWLYRNLEQYLIAGCSCFVHNYAFYIFKCEICQCGVHLWVLQWNMYAAAAEFQCHFPDWRVPLAASFRCCEMVIHFTVFLLEQSARYDKILLKEKMLFRWYTGVLVSLPEGFSGLISWTRVWRKLQWEGMYSTPHTVCSASWTWGSPCSMAGIL